MPVALHVDLIEPDGESIFISHTFYGETEAEAHRRFAQHKSQCPFLTAADADGRLAEDLELIDEMPLAEEEEEEEGQEDDHGEEEEEEET